MKIFLRMWAVGLVAVTAGSFVGARGAPPDAVHELEGRRLVSPEPSAAGSNTFALTGARPADQTVGAPAEAEIRLSFSRPVDPSTATGSHVRVFGRWSGAHTGTLTPGGQGTEIRFRPDRAFAPGEWVTVTLSSALADRSGTTLDRGYELGFWVAAEPGDWTFEEVGRRPVRRPGEGQVRSYGAYAGDFDRDGFGDLMVPNENTNDVRVFLNDGRGDYPGFDLYPIPGGRTPSTNEGGDFDGDGIIDFAVGSSAGELVSVFRGLGDGTFEHHRGYPVGKGVRGLCVVDLNGDGWPDLVAASDQAGSVTTLLNDGSGGFVAAQTLQPMRGVRSCATGDADGDGVVDVFVGSTSTNEVAVLRSDGRGTLTPSEPLGAGDGPWMLAAGDLTGDGVADVVAATSPAGSITVMAGDGQGGLGPPVRYETGKMTLAVDLGDLDGDGDLDVVASVFSTAEWVVFENEGRGALRERMRLSTTQSGSCAILHDRDGDGDVDITGIDETDDWIVLFENR